MTDEMSDSQPGTHHEHGRSAYSSEQCRPKDRTRKRKPPKARKGDEDTEDHDAGHAARDSSQALIPRWFTG
jgi:hypothetical protein